MKSKIGMSLGLAMMLAVGVFATMLALGMFTPSEVQAKVGPVSDVDFSGVQVSAAVSGPAMTTAEKCRLKRAPVAGTRALFCDDFLPCFLDIGLSDRRRSPG